MQIQVINKSGNLLPEYKTQGSAGMDLCADILEPITLKSGERRLIGTGLHMKIPQGYEGQIRPRSGLAAKHGVTVTNSPGTIDSDYTGEIKIILQNTGNEDFTINVGDRIAQLVITPIIQAELVEVTELSETERGEGGFGSTGVSDPSLTIINETIKTLKENERE